jgi:glyoxylase-like metal-dependent hydrolase (beta-lactamase superfamily II)
MEDLGDLALPEVFRTDDVIAYKPHEKLFVLQTRKDVSASIYLVLGASKVLVLDAGMSVLDLTSAIKRATDLPFELALTHGHFDHVSAIAEFDHLYMHPADRDLITNYKGAIIDVQPGYNFDLGDRQIEVVDLAGHTPGSIGFLDATNHWLFTGDALGTNPCYVQLTPLPLDVILKVLATAESRRPTWNEIWCGHANHLNKPQGIEYIKRLRRLVETVLDPAGHYPPEAKLTVGPHAAGLEGQLLIFNSGSLRSTGQ